MASSKEGFTQIFEGLTQAHSFQNSNRNKTTTNTFNPGTSNQKNDVLYPYIKQNTDKTKSLGNSDLFKQRNVKSNNRQPLINDFYNKTNSSQVQGVNVKSTNHIFDKIGKDMYDSNNKGGAGISKEERDRLFAPKA